MKNTITSEKLDHRLLTDILVDQVPGIPNAVATSLSSTHRVRRYDAGDLIVCEGEASTGIFVLICGTVRVLVSKWSKQVTLHETTAPAVLGLTAAMLARPSSFTLVALTPIETAFIPRAQFLGALGQFPQAGLAFSQLIANELADTYSHLSELRSSTRSLSASLSAS